MERLADRYAEERRAHPDARLMIVFDIDGTILDMRYPILRILREWDHAHDTHWFDGLGLDDVDVHEDQTERLLARLGVPEGQRDAIKAWFDARRWEPEALAEAHRPFQGVLEVIRWFQLQPHTFVGLNTARSERLRERTLRSLRTIGAHWKVDFRDERLAMNAGGFGRAVLDAKAEGIRAFEGAGYRPFAFVDNEPANLAAVAEAFPDLLLLHADTIFASQRHALPATAVSGTDYRLARLAPSGRWPERVEMVWRAVNEADRLERFLASSVRWAEIDVRLDPARRTPVLQHAPIAEELPAAARARLGLETVLDAIDHSTRGVQLDLKEGGDLLATALAAVAEVGVPDASLAFNVQLEHAGEKGLRQVRERHPGAVLQCPADFLAPLLGVLPERARRTAADLARLGVDRFGVAWDGPGFRPLVESLIDWGHEVAIYRVPDLEAFLSAALLLPRAVTADLDSISVP
jgi:hypothetical protein